jgi:hypothetical protein
MTGSAARRASLILGPTLLLGVTLLLGGCGHHHEADADSAGDDAINAYPANYKSDILAAMHSYLNDPTGIRDAAISQPALKTSGFGTATRYVVCLHFNPKKSASEYAGTKEIAATFLAGRFDHFADTPHDQCTGAVYTPFPELQKLPP